MKQCDWVVCERSNRWLAAIRKALARDVPRQYVAPRIYEVRTLGDLDARLHTSPNSLAMVEVDHDNVGDVLNWMAQAAQRFARMRLIALVDYSLSPTVGRDSTPQHDIRRLVTDALLEAGATTIVDSPRRIGPVLAIGQQHSEAHSMGHYAALNDQSLSEQAWASLPWQGE